MNQCVEFYFPGLSVAGLNEKEVKSRDVEVVKPFPQYAFAFRFFEKSEKDESKSNFSAYYYIGEEYSISEYKQKIIHQDPELLQNGISRVVKLITGGFRKLEDDDVVINSSSF